MDFLLNLIQSFDFTAIIKLVLAFILSGIIGLERDSWSKPAGFRTHSLVGISAVLVVLCGEYMASKYNIDPSRIPAQLLSGIGFIGAGTILRDGFNVKGLTTASSLLTVTCIGLCIGCGFYFGAIAATVITYLLLSYSYLLTDKLDHFSTSKLLIVLTKHNSETLKKIEELLNEYNIDIKKLEKSEDTTEEGETINCINLDIKYNHNLKLNKVIVQISNLDNISNIEEI